MKMAKPQNNGYECFIYLEENCSRQLLCLSTWFQGEMTYKQALNNQFEILKALEKLEADYHVTDAQLKPVEPIQEDRKMNSFYKVTVYLKQYPMEEDKAIQIPNVEDIEVVMGEVIFHQKWLYLEKEYNNNIIYDKKDILKIVIEVE